LERSSRGSTTAHPLGDSGPKRDRRDAPQALSGQVIARQLGGDLTGGSRCAGRVGEAGGSRSAAADRGTSRGGAQAKSSISTPRSRPHRRHRPCINGTMPAWFAKRASGWDLLQRSPSMTPSAPCLYRAVARRAEDSKPLRPSEPSRAGSPARASPSSA